MLLKKKQSDLKLFLLDKYSETADLKEAQELMKKGQDFCLLSEAGLPCIADPGNIMVAWAHRNNIKVVPVNGPSSIILALISSGFNGQQFTFHGYLPIDKGRKKKTNPSFGITCSEDRLYSDFHGNSISQQPVTGRTYQNTKW